MAVELLELVELGPGDEGWSDVGAAWSPGELALLAPDHPFLAFGEWRAFAAVRGGGVVARMVASIDPRQRTVDGPVGCIGFVDLAAGVPRSTGDARSAGNARSAGVDRSNGVCGPAAARTAFDQVLAAAAGWLRRRGVRVVRGPVQLSTWYGHRAMTDGLPDEGGVPAFPLEPRNGRGLVQALDAGGFRPAHRGVSCLVRSDAVIESAGPVLDRLRRAGFRDRALRPDAIADELALLHRLSGDIFRESWGFSGVSLAEFAALYRPAARLTDPELVRFAMDGDGGPLGFVFALPAAPRAADGAGFVLKTLGLLPEARRRFPGSGAALAALIHRTAIERGLRDGVHALMADGSPAHRTSLRWGTWIRSYATFERALE